MSRSNRTNRHAEAYIPQAQIPLDSTSTINISDNHDMDSTEICIAIEKMCTFSRNEKFRKGGREREKEREERERGEREKERERRERERERGERERKRGERERERERERRETLIFSRKRLTIDLDSVVF